MLLLFRAFVESHTKDTGFPVFVVHLALADCVMGLYLAVIGVADQVFQGDYLWNDQSWRESPFCQVRRSLFLH